MKADYRSLVGSCAEYIETHAASSLSAEDISATASYSYPHFARVFSDLAGMSPLSFARQRKLSHAAQMLLDTDRDIVDIAMDMGFASQQTFTRAFTGTFGMSPLKYRKRGIADGLTAPFVLPPALQSEVFDEINVCELPPMTVASFYAFGRLTRKNRERQQEKVVSKAWGGLITWQMARAWHLAHGIEAPLPPVKEQGIFFVERGLHTPPHTRYFGYNHPFPPQDGEFGYVACAQAPELSREEQTIAERSGIALKAFPGGMYATLRASYGPGSDLRAKWQVLHAWLANSPEYVYGSHQWLEEHLTMPGMGGFHGFRLYMAIEKAGGE